MDYNTTIRKKSFIPLYIALIIPIFCGVGTQIANVVSFIEFFILLYYFRSDEFWALTPIYYIYCSQLVLIGSETELFKIYSIVCLIRMLFITKKIDIKDKSTLVIFLLMAYASFVLAIWTNLWGGVVLFLQSIALYYSVTTIKQNYAVRALFKKTFIFICISAALYGIIFENIKGIFEQESYWIQTTGRYSGTMSDPNYMAFFYCIALVYTIFSKEWKSSIKTVIEIVLFIAIAITGSLTALLSIALIIIIYILLGSERKLKYKFFAVLGIITLSLIFYNAVFLDNIDIPVLSMYKVRLAEKMGYIGNGDISSITTGRSEYSQFYVEYLFNSNPLRILFGGYQLNSMGLVGTAYESIGWAAHNTYVDILMTTGIIGLCAFIFAVILNIYKNIRIWLTSRNEENFISAIRTGVALFYMMGLSLFPSTSYMFFIMF